MSQWDYIQYRKIIERFLNQKDSIGIRMLSRKDIYEYLSIETGIAQPGAFEAWAKTDSNGPKPSTLKFLEEFFNMKLTYDMVGEKEEHIMSEVLSYFESSHTFEACKIIKKFLKSDVVDNEDAYFAMQNNLEMEKMGMPEGVILKLDKFLKDYIEPIIFRHGELFGVPADFSKFIKQVIEVEKQFDMLINEIKTRFC